jgi:hypothetical protein
MSSEQYGVYDSSGGILGVGHTEDLAWIRAKSLTYMTRAALEYFGCTCRPITIIEGHAEAPKGEPDVHS